VPPRGPRNSAAWMRPRPTQIQPVDRGAIAAPARDRTHEQNLVESELSVVEALLDRLQRDLVGPNLQELRHAIREGVMRARRDELHMKDRKSTRLNSSHLGI